MGLYLYSLSVKDRKKFVLTNQMKVSIVIVSKRDIEIDMSVGLITAVFSSEIYLSRADFKWVLSHTAMN